MLKKIANLILVGLIGVLLLPTSTNAAVENFKKEIGETIYTGIYKSYENEELEDKYYYLYGVISPNKYVIYEDEEEDENDEYYLFEDGSYRDTKATAAEIIESRKNLWNVSDEGFYFNEYTEEEVEKVAIFYNNQFVRMIEGYCYIDNTDLTEVEEKDYYTQEYSLLDTPFDPEEAHNYLVRVNCDEHIDVIKKVLTNEQKEAIEANIDARETEYEDKFNVNSFPAVAKMKDGYLVAISIRYTEEDIDYPNHDDYIYNYAIYDLSGNLIEEIDQIYDYGYLGKSDLYYIVTGEGLNIYDSKRNLIYNTPLAVDEYIYAFDFDENKILIDFENGKYLELTRYVVETGENQTFTDKDLSIKFNGDLDLLEKVMVNDKELDAKNYTKTEGSTIITLSKDYLNTLANGTYTLKTIYSDGGEAATTFIIDGESNPKTGSDIMSIIIIGTISIIGVLGTSLYLKKKRYN